MQQAVATSSACGLPIALASALSFMLLGWHEEHLPPHSLGYVYLPALVGIAVTSMFCPFRRTPGAQVGATLVETPVRSPVVLCWPQLLI